MICTKTYNYVSMFGYQNGPYKLLRIHNRVLRTQTSRKYIEGEKEAGVSRKTPTVVPTGANNKAFANS